MRAIRDLRDLVNVSRLTYREDSDNEFENEYSVNSSNNFNSKSITNYSNQQPVINHDNYLTSKQKRINGKMIVGPIQSKSSPIQLEKKRITNSNVNINPSLVLRDREQLLERNSVVKFTNIKKPLPPLASSSLTSNSNVNFLDKQNDTNQSNLINKSIEPLALNDLDNSDTETSNLNDQILQTRYLNGNFDDILTFVDASVVSDWLNRANRYLKKMLRWHQDNTNIYQTNQKKLLKFESFILFCNFWLGNNENVKFTDKQRRSIIEMEYSIINDEVMQAFQVGLDSQSISVSDVNHLLRAVFKEYPIQLLSFRGSYLILDFIDVLSSDRDNDYKRLLSDVKCRTVNKQYAQWLLSIRSFSLINLCWSIIKFYRKTVEDQILNYDGLFSSRKDANKIAELDGRLSSLSVSNMLNDKKDTASVTSSTSSLSSNSSQSSELNKSAKSSSSSKCSNRIKTRKNKKNTCSIYPTYMKYEHYLEAVFKNDLPDVLHYLITTKKCDPYIKDEHNRTLIFKAVMNEKPKILKYLIKRWPSIDINESCDSGNTPLHAAVNKRKLDLVEILLDSLNNKKYEEDFKGENDNDDDYENKSNIFNSSRKAIILDLNKQNPKCMNATALHLAVWNDYNEIALKLIQNKADPNLKMNGLSTAFDLAKENSNDILYDLLVEYSSINTDVGLNNN